jgi:hypothetical protein
MLLETQIALASLIIAGSGLLLQAWGVLLQYRAEKRERAAPELPRIVVVQLFASQPAKALPPRGKKRRRRKRRR